MQKSKQEQQESIMTIKELYQLAELLKLENHKLIGAQEEQQQLQQKLVSAVTENQDLKHYLDSVMKKQQNDSVSKTDVHMNQLAKLRNVIQYVFVNNKIKKPELVFTYLLFYFQRRKINYSRRN